MGKLIDITGETFGRLQVVGLSHIVRPDGHTSRAFWNCVCRCGNSVVMRGDGLKSGHAKSCGCQKIDSASSTLVDLTGKRFGRLVVLEIAHRKVNGTGFYWKCLCDCGSVRVSHSQPLKSGRTKSCGCYQRDIMKSRSGENSPSWRGGSWSRELYSEEWTTKLKEFVRDRDERKCQYPDCDYTDIGKPRRIPVHHIDRDKMNCRSYNLISLCSSHHITVEKNHTYWMDYFYSVTRDYES